MEYYAKITSKGQIVIPKEIRELLNLSQNSFVVFEVGKNNEVKIKKGIIVKDG